MKKRYAIVAMTVLVLGIFISSERAPESVHISTNSVILAFGDSLTKGTGTSIKNSYPSQLENLLGVTVINAGVPGELSIDGVERLSTLLKSTNPDLVILCHGGNDILQKYPQKQLESNVREMIEMTQFYGAELILIGVPKPSINLKTLAIYEQLSEEYDLVSDHTILSELLKKPALKSDRVHLNANGYKQLAVEISKRIELGFD